MEYFKVCLSHLTSHTHTHTCTSNSIQEGFSTVIPVSLAHRLCRCRLHIRWHRICPILHTKFAKHLLFFSMLKTVYVICYNFLSLSFTRSVLLSRFESFCKYVCPDSDFSMSMSGPISLSCRWFIITRRMLSSFHIRLLRRFHNIPFNMIYTLMPSLNHNKHTFSRR